MSSPHWSASLRAYNQQHPPAHPSGKHTEKEVIKELRAEYTRINEEKAKRDPSLRVIPSFFHKENNHTLAQRAHKEARTRFLENKAEGLLDEEQLENLWTAVQTHQSAPLAPPATGPDYRMAADYRINYDAFCVIKNTVPAKGHHFFRPEIFLKFAMDKYGRISARAFFQYVIRSVSLAQLRISLTCYDELAQGYLREQDLENYIFEQISSLPQLQSLEVDFYPYYVFTAVRKFVFFLDPLRKGKIAIKDIVSSPILREFYELRQERSEDMELLAEHEWFSSRAALRIYATYLALDADHNGMLSKEEFSRYNGGSLTSVFVDRLFQEYRMYKTENNSMEMDYKTFLDFVLAMQYKEQPQGLRYFWPVLDINHCGYLTLFNLNYFFKAVVKKMTDLGHEPVRVEDVTSEIFDMVRPAQPDRITLDDLIACRVGHTVVSILTDVNGFWQYDNREVLLAHEHDDHR